MCWQLYACVCPPCSVAAKRGCGGDCCINFFLSVLGYVPGCVHACFVVSSDNSKPSTTVVIQNQPQTTTMVSLPAPVATQPPMGYPNPLYPNGYGQGDAPPMYTSSAPTYKE